MRLTLTPGEGHLVPEQFSVLVVLVVRAAQKNPGPPAPSIFVALLFLS